MAVEAASAEIVTEAELVALDPWLWLVPGPGLLGLSPYRICVRHEGDLSLPTRIFLLRFGGSTGCTEGLNVASSRRYLLRRPLRPLDAVDLLPEFLEEAKLLLSTTRLAALTGGIRGSWVLTEPSAPSSTPCMTLEEWTRMRTFPWRSLLSSGREDRFEESGVE